MRWQFSDPTNETERARREATLARIDAFWRGFAEHHDDFAATFRKESDFDLVGWMQSNLGGVDPRIMWEFGPAVSGPGHRLVATTEGTHELRPMVDTLIARAPALEGWEFYGYRLAEPVEQALMTVRARTGIDLGDAKVSVAPAAGRSVAIRLCTPQMRWGSDDALWSAGLIAIEALIGEETLDRWVGPIDVEPMPRKRGWGLFRRKATIDDTLLPLGELRGRVEAVIEELRAGRDASPFHTRDPETASWRMFRVDSDLEGSGDYPRQADLAVARTMAPELWEATQGPGLFFDARFSAHGECFAYVKIDQDDVDPNHRVDAKAPIEDAVVDHLARERRGALYASGSGFRYAYLDVALSDRDRGVEELRTLLQQLEVPRRSWILFFEAHLAGEWVGVYPDTPPPPEGNAEG